MRKRSPFESRGESGMELERKAVMLSACPEPVAVCVSRSRMASSGSVRIASSRVCSVTATLASSRCIGAQKNRVRNMRQGGAHLLRPKATAGAGPVLRRQASVPGPRSPPRRLCALRQGEAGEARLPREESVLHQALRLLRRPSMPVLDDQGRRPRAAPGTRSRLSRSSTCRSSFDAPGHQGRR